MSGVSPIDGSAIDRLKQWGGVDLPRRMVDIFLRHAPERLDQIRSGLSKADPREVEMGAHSLKSSAGNLGALRVQELSLEVEGLAEKGSLDGVHALMPELEEAFSDACQALAHLMQELEE